MSIVSGARARPQLCRCEIDSRVVVIPSALAYTLSLSARGANRTSRLSTPRAADTWRALLTKHHQRRGVRARALSTLCARASDVIACNIRLINRSSPLSPFRPALMMGLVIIEERRRRALYKGYDGRARPSVSVAVSRSRASVLPGRPAHHRYYPLFCVRVRDARAARVRLRRGKKKSDCRDDRADCLWPLAMVRARESAAFTFTFLRDTGFVYMGVVRRALLFGCARA